MCKCFLGRHGAYWLSSSFGGAFVTKAFITLAPARQQDSSLVSALLSDLISSHTNSQTQQTRRSQPPPCCLSRLVSLPPKETAIWFGYTRTAILGVSTEKGLNSAILFPDCLFDIPKCVIQIQPGSFQSNPRGYTVQGLPISLSPTLSTSTHPLSFSVPVSVSSTYNSPSLSYLSISAFRFPVCWRMNCQSCLQYQLLCLAWEQRTEGWNQSCVERGSLASAFLLRHTVSPVLFWSIIGVILISFSHSDQHTDNRLMHCIAWIGW